MSHWASSWAYEQPIKLSGRKFVLVALANFADSEGFCFPGQDTLADMTGQDVRSVQRHLTALEKAGFINRKHRHKGARRTSDGYTLLADRPLKPNTTNCQVANTTNCHQDKLSPDLLDHKADPSVVNPPLPPKRKRSHKPPEAEIVIDPPYRSDAFNDALSRYESHTRQRGGKITQAQRDELYAVLHQCGSEQIAIDALKMSVRCGWKGVFPERLNGNGHKKPEQEYTGPVRSVPDPVKENCQTCFGTGIIKRKVNGYEYAEICKHRGNGVAVA